MGGSKKSQPPPKPTRSLAPRSASHSYRKQDDTEADHRLQQPPLSSESMKEDPKQKIEGKDGNPVLILKDSSNKTQDSPIPSDVQWDDPSLTPVQRAILINKIIQQKFANEKANANQSLETVSMSTNESGHPSTSGSSSLFVKSPTSDSERDISPIDVNRELSVEPLDVVSPIGDACQVFSMEAGQKPFDEIALETPIKVQKFRDCGGTVLNADVSLPSLNNNSNSILQTLFSDKTAQQPVGHPRGPNKVDSVSHTLLGYKDQARDQMANGSEVPSPPHGNLNEHAGPNKESAQIDVHYDANSTGPNEVDQDINGSIPSLADYLKMTDIDLEKDKGPIGPPPILNDCNNSKVSSYLSLFNSFDLGKSTIRLDDGLVDYDPLWGTKWWNRELFEQLLSGKTIEDGETGLIYQPPSRDQTGEVEIKLDANFMAKSYVARGRQYRLGTRPGDARGTETPQGRAGDVSGSPPDQGTAGGRLLNVSCFKQANYTS